MAGSTSAREERYQQVREACLRQWFSETKSNDENTRLAAQARLYVLLIVREYRGQLASPEGQTTRWEGYGTEAATESWAQILRGEKAFTDAEVEIWAGRWKAKMTLQKLLMDDTYDRPADFCCTAESLQATHPPQDQFRRMRDDKLRAWYADAMSTHKLTRDAARKRLQLQRNIRTFRIHVGDCRERCNACKRNGDEAGAATAQRDIYRTNGRIQSTCLSMREGQELSKRQNGVLLRQWEEDTPTVEDMLAGLEHDRVEDFGVVGEEEES